MARAFLKSKSSRKSRGDFHAQRLGVEVAGLLEIRLGRVRHIRVRLGGELVGVCHDDVHHFLLAPGREQPRRLALIDRRCLLKLLLLDQRLGLQERRLEPPVGFRERLGELVRHSGCLGEPFGVEQRQHFEVMRLVGLGIFGGYDLVCQRDGRLVMLRPQFCPKRVERRRLGPPAAGGQTENDRKEGGVVTESQARDVSLQVHGIRSSRWGQRWRPRSTLGWPWSPGNPQSRSRIAALACHAHHSLETQAAHLA